MTFAPSMTDEVVASTWASFLLKGHDQGEYELRRDDGSRLMIAYTATARVAAGRHFTIMRDITERKLDEELRAPVAAAARSPGGRRRRHLGERRDRQGGVVV